MRYRAEIDGLRALAVLPVILFHAGFERFSGGFVGVDIFFVISGYLITSILIEDIENNRLRITDFYERRARRLLPALFLIILICIPFAYMWMIPSQLLDFSQSLIAVSLFVSNIFFWLESGYFEAAAEEKPLLHTWSLAVEEQYYLLFPIFLIIFWRFGRNKVFWIIVAMALISYLLSEWGWRNKSIANFYLAPTRAWELFAGSITAFILQKKGIQKNNLMAFLGLFAITFSIFVYDESTPFPSMYTLVPILGVVILLIYADKHTFVARILSTKFLVGIGLISYSAYLWHQPLFAFTRIKMLNTPSNFLMIFMSLLSLMLAWITWKFVEKPFRKANKFSKYKVFSLSIFGIALFIIIGVFGNINNGYENRFDYSVIDIVGIEKEKPDVNELFGCPEKNVNNLDSIFCHVNHLNEPKFAIFGDSHADIAAMAINSSNNFGFVVSSLGGCPPLQGIDIVRGNWDLGVCQQLSLKHIEYIKENPQIKKVLLVGRWSLYTSGDYDQSMQKHLLVNKSRMNTSQKISRQLFQESVTNTIRAYEDLGVAVYILLQIPQQKFTPIDAIHKTYFSDYAYNNILLKTPKKLHNELQNFNRTVFEKLIIKNENVFLINLDDMFCDQNNCYMLDEKSLLYRDKDHLSFLGVKHISGELTNAIKDK